MRRFVNRKSIVAIFMALALIAAVAAGFVFRGGATSTRAANAAVGPKTASGGHPVCKSIGHTIQVSSGLRIQCLGNQGNSSTQHNGQPAAQSFGTNVNAANPAEDVSTSGVQAYGQSETSIASAGPYVVEAWNDASTFFNTCGAPMNKEEGTGFAFSNDGGKHFTDLGGLPNANCANSLYEGDPSVEVYQHGGSTYFYISSIFVPFNIPENELAIAACKVQGSGSSATLSCSQPIVAAISSDCVVSPPSNFCSFLDKEFLTVDPVRGRLYMSYTEFGVTSQAANDGIVELAVCDLKANPASPTCFNGSLGSSGSGQPPYFVVAPGDPNCENEGAYPAADLATGAVYVAYEHNWSSPLFSATCANVPVQNVMNYIPLSCLTLTPTSPCSGPAATNAITINSMQAAFIPGYSRFPMNDFPRLAVSDHSGTVSMVWNDTRFHPAGDILLQSFNRVSLALVQSSPVRVNSSTGGWHMLPALRNVDGDGDLNISFYSRAKANTDVTDVYAAIDVDPRTTSAVTNNVKVTTAPSSWFDVSSDINPNFGDYTDNYVQAKASSPYTTQTLYVAWSDGRLGDPQPFSAQGHTN